MNILYVSDDNFAEIAGVSILSLFENNKEVDEIAVYLVDGGISDVNIRRLIDISTAYQRELTFLNAPDIESIVGTTLYTHEERWSIAAFSRLFISSILPDDIEKMIYIDCDTIIRGSLEELWVMDQGRNIVSGHATQIGLVANERIMLNRNDLHINSGIMLINLSLWRTLNVEEKYIKFIRLMDGRIHSVDQGVINSVLKGYIGIINPTYNCSPAYAIVNECIEPNPADKVPIHEKIVNPKIIHYIGDDINIGIYARPWNKWNEEDSSIVYPDIRDEWLKYKAMSPWKDEPLRQLRGKTSKRKKGIVGLIKKCKPLYDLLINAKNAASRAAKKTRKQMTPQEYLAHREKVTGIKLEDCRIPTCFNREKQ